MGCSPNDLVPVHEQIVGREVDHRTIELVHHVEVLAARLLLEAVGEAGR